MKSQKVTTCLYVGCLSSKCTKTELFQLFCIYGEIKDIYIQRLPLEESTKLTYGFVRFLFQRSAQEAKLELSGKIVHGERIRIGWAMSDYEAMENKMTFTKRTETSSQVHVSFISEQIDLLVTEKVLEELFSAFGRVVQVKLVRSNILPATDKRSAGQSGHGFIHFPCNEEGVESACAAIVAINQHTIDLVRYDCEHSHKVKVLHKSVENSTSQSSHSDNAHSSSHTSLASTSTTTSQVSGVSRGGARGHSYGSSFGSLESIVSSSDRTEFLPFSGSSIDTSGSYQPFYTHENSSILLSSMSSSADQFSPTHAYRVAAMNNSQAASAMLNIQPEYAVYSRPVSPVDTVQYVAPLSPSGVSYVPVFQLLPVATSANQSVQQQQQLQQLQQQYYQQQHQQYNLQHMYHQQLAHYQQQALIQQSMQQAAYQPMQCVGVTAAPVAQPSSAAQFDSYNTQLQQQWEQQMLFGQTHHQ